MLLLSFFCLGLIDRIINRFLFGARLGNASLGRKRVFRLRSAWLFDLALAWPGTPSRPKPMLLGFKSLNRLIPKAHDGDSERDYSS
jgi:hypothetical protein